MSEDDLIFFLLIQIIFYLNQINQNKSMNIYSCIIFSSLNQYAKTFN